MAGKLKIIFGGAFRTLRRLFLEVTGTFFLAMAVMGAASTVQEYTRYADTPELGIWRLALSVCFTVGSLILGLHTFWKSRKIQP